MKFLCSKWCCSLQSTVYSLQPVDADFLPYSNHCHHTPAPFWVRISVYLQTALFYNVLKGLLFNKTFDRTPQHHGEWTLIDFEFGKVLDGPFSL